MPPPKKVHDGGSYRDQPKPIITRTDEEVLAVVKDRINRAEAGLPVPELEGKPILTYVGKEDDSPIKSLADSLVRECFICGKQKGQPPERCPGHYLPLPMPSGVTELYRFVSIGGVFRLRMLPAQPMLPERIILERRVSHLHEKEEWDLEWRQQ